MSRPAALARAIATLPSDDDGRVLERSLLDAIEELASSTSMALPAHFFDPRREIVNGQR